MLQNNTEMLQNNPKMSQNNAEMLQNYTEMLQNVITTPLHKNTQICKHIFLKQILITLIKENVI